MASTEAGATPLRILLIGVGRHSSHTHLPVLRLLADRGLVSLVAAVDLPARRVAPRPAERLAATGWASTPLYELHGTSDLDDALDQLAARHRVEAVVVATPAHEHLPYVRWALSREVHVLTDKPVVARAGASCDEEAAALLAGDVELLTRAVHAHAAKGLVSAALVHRRANPAYRLVHEVLNETCTLTGCPVTSITVEHSDGEWRTPGELLDQEYHGVTNGTGALSHSGYHLLDIVQWWHGAGPSTGQLEIDVRTSRPPDHLAQLSPVVLERALGQGRSWRDERDRALAAPVQWGEWDVHVLMRERANEITLSTLSLHVLHTSCSHRSWAESTGRDLYTGNGRMSHDTVSIHVGPFLSIKVIAWQGGARSAVGDPYAIEGPRHCEVHIFRNPDLIPGPSHETRRLSDLETVGTAPSIGPGKLAVYEDFVNACATGGSLSLNTGLDEQMRTMRVYAQTCEAMAREHASRARVPSGAI